MVTQIKVFKKPRLRNPVLIEGLPGVGNVGRIAAGYLVEELRAEKFAELLSSHFMPLVLVREDGTSHLLRNEFFYWKAKKKNKPETQKEFYAEISSALLSFLANKLNISEAGIITNTVKKQLRDRGIAEKTIEKYFNCLETCDFQRFAPAQSDQNSMNKLYEEARNAITSLQKEM